MIICPIHESNDCHNPAGPGGGRFCGNKAAYDRGFYHGQTGYGFQKADAGRKGTVQHTSYRTGYDAGVDATGYGTPPATPPTQPAPTKSARNVQELGAVDASGAVRAYPPTWDADDPDASPGNLYAARHQGSDQFKPGGQRFRYDEGSVVWTAKPSRSSFFAVESYYLRRGYPVYRQGLRSRNFTAQDLKDE